MPTDLQKLARAVARIRRATPARSKACSVIVENPFESGYWPPAPEVPDKEMGYHTTLKKNRRVHSEFVI